MFDETNSMHLYHDCPTPGGVTLAIIDSMSEIPDESWELHPSYSWESGTTNRG